MILTRSTRLSQPADAAGVDSRFGGRNDWLIAPGSPGSLPISGVVPTIPDQYGSSHYFDGASLQLLGNDANVNATGGQFTLLAYAKFDNTTSDHGVVGNRATIGANAYAQIVHRAPSANRRIVFTYKGASASAEVGILSAAQSIPTGSTQLVAMVVNGTSVRCYVGSELVGSGVSTSPAPSGHLPYLRAGNYYDNSTIRRFIGGIYYAGLLPVALSGEDIGALARNPWQVFRPVQRRIYFDIASGGGDVVLAGSSASQVNTSSSGAITQAHVLSGASVDQSNTSTSGAIGQSIILTGASVSQGNASTSGAVSQAHVLIGSNCQQANTSTSGAVVQTGDLIGANCAQVNTSSSGSISQTHVLSGASCTQPNTTTSGAVIIVSGVILTGANCAQGNTTTTGAISQSHVLIGAPVAIDHIATASSIVQTHILSGADCSQSNYSTTGSINQVVIPSQFVASVPAGVFSARAPAGEYSATVPSGNYRPSI